MVGTVLLILLGILLALLLAAVFRALTVGRKTADYSPPPQPERERSYAEKLSRMVQMETVSVRGAPDPEKYRAFHGLLRSLYPKVFAACEYHDLEGCLLLRWRGVHSDKPVMFLGHMDVVEASTPDAWKYPPFSGAIAEGRVWGRGASDTKCSLMAFLQAAEELIGEGFVPVQDIYLGSSCTEEIGGDGAPRMTAWLQERGIKLAMLCDEGGCMLADPIAGVKGIFAMVGLFEKGYGDVRFSAKGKGGHSSAPPAKTPIARLAAFICEVERKSPFRARISPEVKALFLRMAPYCGFGLRLVMSNLWLFGGAVKLVMRHTQVDAMLRTTICFTMQKGSDGTNVIPREASVIANLRFIPHQGMEESLRIITEKAKRFGLESEFLHGNDHTRPVDMKGEAFRLTERSIAHVFPGVGICPYVVTGGTDARFFEGVCDNLIRFSPVLYRPEALSAMHGIDEHLDCDTLPGAVDYYKALAKGLSDL